MSTRRVADAKIELPENPLWIEFKRSDGDRNTWPKNTSPIVDHEGHVNFMQELELTSYTAIKWRTGVAKAIAAELKLPEGGTYVLKSWPDQYRMYDHHKGPQNNPRHDIYLFGAKSKFRSINEFIPHAIWLMQDPDSADCQCKYCSKKTQKEITYQMSISGILPSTPSASSPSSRPKPPPKPRAIKKREFYASLEKTVQPSKLSFLKPSPSALNQQPILAERNNDIRAVCATTTMSLKRWYRQGEVVWCALDVPICGPTGDAIEFWPGLVEETTLKSNATALANLANGSEFRKSPPSKLTPKDDSRMNGETPRGVVLESNSKVPPLWTVEQSSNYKVQLLAVSRKYIFQDKQVVPYQALANSSEFGKKLTRFMDNSLDLDHEKLKRFDPCAEPNSIDFAEAVAPYVAAIHIAREAAGFYSLTDDWELKYSTPSTINSPPDSRLHNPLVSAIESASRYNSYTSPPHTESAKPSLATAMNQIPPNQVVQPRYQGLWWGPERIWVDDFVRLKLPRQALAPEGNRNIFAPSGPGPTKIACAKAQNVDPSLVGADSWGLFMRLDGLLLADIEGTDGLPKKETRMCGVLYELADVDWVAPEDQNKPTSGHAESDPSSESFPPYPLPEAPRGFRFRPILAPGYEVVLNLGLLSGRYYPRLLYHPVIQKFIPGMDVEETHADLWALDGLCAGFENSIDPRIYKRSRAQMLEDAKKNAMEELETHERLRKQGADGFAMDVDV